MQVTLRFVFDDPDESRKRVFELAVDRPYPGVPRVGEAVVPDDRGQLAARTITQVSYNPDGTLVLDLELGASADKPEALVMALESLGFAEEAPRLHL